jgi:MFS family permease
MYYATSIMAAVLDLGNAKYVCQVSLSFYSRSSHSILFIQISLFIAFINLLLTFPSIYLIERLGRKSLILLSCSIMTVSSLVLAFSISSNEGVISSVAIVLFVAGFSIGLGPVPFAILSEVVPSYVRTNL